MITLSGLLKVGQWCLVLLASSVCILSDFFSRLSSVAVLNRWAEVFLQNVVLNIAVNLVQIIILPDATY